MFGGLWGFIFEKKIVFSSLLLYPWGRSLPFIPFLTTSPPPPLLFSSVLYSLHQWGGVGWGGGQFSRQRPLIFRKNSKPKAVACVLFIIHTESSKIVLKIFNVVKTTASHVCMWAVSMVPARTLLDSGASPPAWEPQPWSSHHCRCYSAYPLQLPFLHFLRFPPDVAVNHPSPQSSRLRSTATISGCFTFTCFSSWICKSHRSLARSVSDTFAGVWPRALRKKCSRMRFTCVIMSRFALSASMLL